MSTSFRGGYVRGVTALLGADDGVDAGAVSDLLVGNAGHIFDAHHSHIVNICTLSGGTAVVRQTNPNSLSYTMMGRWWFEPIEQSDGGSAKVVYRIGFRRSGGRGAVTIGVRIQPIGSDRAAFLPIASAAQNTHTTTSATGEVVRGELYVPAEQFTTRYPLGTDDVGALRRSAFVEVWCTHSGLKPTIELKSVMARQFLRVPATDANAVLREDSAYVLREDGSYVLRE